MMDGKHNIAVNSGNPIRYPNKFHRPMQTGLGNWMSVCSYVAACKDVRSSICRSCGTGKVYDNNKVSYIFTRAFSMEAIKTLIKKVRTINSSNE